MSETRSMSDRERLFTWDPHADPEDVRLRRLDVSYDFGFILKREMSVPPSCNRETRIGLLNQPHSFVKHLSCCTQKIETDALQFGQARNVVEQVRRRDALWEWGSTLQP